MSRKSDVENTTVTDAGENDGSSQCTMHDVKSEIDCSPGQDSEGGAVSGKKPGKRSLGKKGVSSGHTDCEQVADGPGCTGCASETTAGTGGTGGDTDTNPSESSAADPITALNEDLKAERDRYLRLAAEFDNYRKRTMKERESIYGDARADTITRLLPVYDNLERALKMECSDEAYYKGVEMTMTQLTEILEAMGVSRISAAGEPFDPNRHNAVMSVVDPELGEKIVAEEYQRGFMLGERVIRFSTVVVAN